eukprot:6272271-Amphidinium_carterae.2
MANVLGLYECYQGVLGTAIFVLECFSWSQPHDRLRKSLKRLVQNQSHKPFKAALGQGASKWGAPQARKDFSGFRQNCLPSRLFIEPFLLSTSSVDIEVYQY